MNVCASDVVVLLENIPRILNEYLLWGRKDIVFEVIEGYIATGGFVEPLKVELEVVGYVLLDVELVDRKAVRHEHGPLSQFCLLVAVVLLGDGIVGVFEDLCRGGGTRRYAVLISWKLDFL